MTEPGHIEEVENPACYCMTCDWQGHEEDLAEYNGFACCPMCESLDIVFTE